MDTRKSLIVASLALLVILGIVFGTIFYFVRLFQARQTASNPTSPASSGVVTSSPDSSNTQSDFIFSSPAPTASSRSNTQDTANNSDMKTYNGQSFQLKYPKSWGLLTCSNSSHIELDPTTSQDILNANCIQATKPVTILIDRDTNCGGENITLGNIQAQKRVTKTDAWTQYQWCTKTEPMLNISHRTSSQNLPANSKEDFSRQIEQIISSLTFARGS